MAIGWTAGGTINTRTRTSIAHSYEYAKRYGMTHGLSRRFWILRDLALSLRPASASAMWQGLLCCVVHNELFSWSA
eukprot:scaffold564043_cov36-Prasinocladus_malaysianus.AAC.1